MRTAGFPSSGGGLPNHSLMQTPLVAGHVTCYVCWEANPPNPHPSH